LKEFIDLSISVNKKNKKYGEKVEVVKTPVEFAEIDRKFS
jgi:hypothetical protein